jgi:uncharacterized membrane protein
MDAWDKFFSEKSRRRAKAVAWRSVANWSLVAAAFVAFVTGFLTLLNMLL